jgi:branched-chain amino acid transport system ATP-binding protein
MLEVSGAGGSYGAGEVVKGISLTVGAGEFVALLGPNGAGKTTFLKMTVGLLPCRRGRITLDGEVISGLSTPAILERHVALVPEGRQIFGPLTVFDNLELGAYQRRRRGDDRAAVAGDLERVFSLFPVLKERRQQLAGTLSGGEQQMLAIGRALMSRPRLLLLDEPSLGLAPRVVGTIMATLERLRGDGLTILLVEQNAKLALAMTNRAYLMRTGEIVLADTSERLRANDDVVRAYLGMS